MSNSFFDQVREKAQHIRQEPGSDVWGRIEGRISQNKGQRHTRLLAMRRAYWRVAAVAATLLLLIGVMFWMAENKAGESGSLATNYPLQVEELPELSTDSAVNMQRKTDIETPANPVTVTHYKPLRPINEGQPQQKLLVRQDKNAPSPTLQPGHDSTRNAGQEMGR